MKKGIVIYVVLFILFSLYFFFSNNHAITQFGYYGESDEWRAVIVSETKDGHVNYYENEKFIGKSFVLVEYIGDVNKYHGKEVMCKISVGGRSHGIGSATFEAVAAESTMNFKNGFFVFRDNRSLYRNIMRLEDKIFFEFEVEGEIVEKLEINQPLFEEISINDYYKHSAKWNRLYRKYGLID